MLCIQSNEMSDYPPQSLFVAKVLAPKQSDLVCWQKIQSGDEEAFSFLFNKYYEPLYQFCGMFVKDSQMAEIIVQDVFVRLWTNKENCKIQTSVKAYLYTSVKNHSLNYLKQAKKTISLFTELDYHDEAANSPEIEFMENEMYAEVHKAIDKLPKQCRQVYLMKRYDELKYSEIAEILSISVNTVKTQMKRAIKSLSKNLSYLEIFS